MRTTKQSVNKITLTIAATLLAVGLLAGAGPAQAKPQARSATIAVRGDWFNDLNCIPLAASPTPAAGAVNVECQASSAWGGDFTGREFAHAYATIQPNGVIDGTYHAVFVGTYLGDHSTGALDETGYFHTDENGTFLARATINGGTCDWAGSGGTIAFDGFDVNGGYVGQWTRPVTRPASDPTCIPMKQLP